MCRTVFRIAPTTFRKSRFSGVRGKAQVGPPHYGPTRRVTRGDGTILDVHILESIRGVVSAIFQWIFILAAATSPIALNVWAWRRLRRPPIPDRGTPLRRRSAYIGLASNLCGYALPLGAAIRNVVLATSGRPVRGDEFVDWNLIMMATVALLLLSLALGAIGPKYVRLQLMLAPVLPFLFWISLPLGV